MIEHAQPQHAGGQTLRLPGTSRDAALHDQLFRYAQDMQTLLHDHDELEQRYRTLRESYESVAEGRAVLEGLINTSRDIYLMTDRSGTILRCNAAARVLAPGMQLLGVDIGDLVLPSDLPAYAALQARLTNGDAPPRDEVELGMKAPGSGAATLIALLCPMPVTVNGELRGIHWMIRDVTHVREAEFESKISSLVMSSAAEGVIITDCEGDILAVNAAFTRISGYSAEEAVGRNPRFLHSGLQDREFYEAMWRAMRTEGSWQGKISNRRKNGEIYTGWMALTTARDIDGKALSYIAVFSDLTPLAQAEQRLFHLTHHDPLTELPNRLLLQDRLQQMIGHADRRGESFALLHVDLDRFKQVNDRFGHAVGDMALQVVAVRLRAAIRAVDTVARIGGDEFVILAPWLGHESDIHLVANKIVNSLDLPLSVEGHEFNVGASVGCAMYPDHGTDLDSLLRHADAAMYQSKQSGGHRHTIYRPAEEPSPETPIGASHS